MTVEPSREPRRVLPVADQPTSITVDGEVFLLAVSQSEVASVDAVSSALSDGRVLALPLHDGGTLILNGRTVRTVSVGAPDDPPPPRRALVDE